MSSIEKNNIHLNLNLEWFNITLDGNKLEIVTIDGTDVLHFDFNDGSLHVLNRIEDTRYFNDPVIRVTETGNPIKIFYDFMAVLRK